MSLKRIMFVLLLLFTAISHYAVDVLNKSHGFKISNQYDIDLEFSESNRYNLFLIYDIDGIGYHLIVSSGTFTSKNNILLLKDLSTQYIFRFKVWYDNANTLICLYSLNGYGWMKGKCYYYIDNNQYCRIPIDVTQSDINRNLSGAVSNNCTLKQDKTYLYERNGFQYTFNFVAPDRYIYKFMGFVLSEGNYKRRNNQIDLYDDSIRTHFTAYIAHGTITSMFLPVGSKFMFVEQ